MIAEVSNSFSINNNFLPVFDFIPLHADQSFWQWKDMCQLLDKSCMAVYGIIYSWMEQNK